MDQATLIAWLVGSSVTLGGAVVLLLSWFARRIVNQLEALQTQGIDTRELLREDMHRHDLRITKLENWREGVITGSSLRP